MTQKSLIVGNVGFAAYRAAMNDAFADLGSTSGGAGRPAGALAGRMWIDDDVQTPGPPIIWRLMLFDGSQDLEIATIDVTNDKVYPRGAVGARVVAQAGAYTVDQFEQGQLHTQSGTYTVNLPAAATVGDGWSITIVNIGTGTITIDGNAAETINGALTYVMEIQFSAVHLVSDGSNWVTANTEGSPSGIMTPFAGATAPAGWLLCDGTAVSRTTYAKLFAVISTAYGVGDGSTTFNLPDMRGRLPLGQDDMGGTSANRVTHAQADSLGGSEGSETHVLTAAEMPSHDHTVRTGPQSAAIGGAPDKWYAERSSTSTAQGQTSEPAGGDGAHENMPPYLVFDYIIKT